MAGGWKNKRASRSEGHKNVDGCHAWGKSSFDTNLQLRHVKLCLHLFSTYIQLTGLSRVAARYHCLRAD